jgi:hypothetical protein
LDNCAISPTVVGAKPIGAFAGIGQEPDARLAKPFVHMWVVDDLAGQKDVAAGEPAPGLICVVDGPIDAVAEPELAREPHAQPS